MNSVFQVQSLKRPKLVCIASGKGGVGKTAFTASLAFELAQLGKKVIAIDADFGGPDLHEWMGIDRPERTLKSFFAEPRWHLEDLRVATQHKNLDMICGEIGSLDFSNPKFFLRQKFMRQLGQLDADFVLVDSSPGTLYTTIDLFLTCDEGIMVTHPDPTSYMDAFNFLRVALIRKLTKTLSASEVAMRFLRDFEKWDWEKYDRSLRPILVKIDEIDPEAGLLFKKVLAFFRIKLITNMVFETAELEESENFAARLQHLLMIRPELLGYIHFNKNLRRSIKKHRPFILSQAPDPISPPAAAAKQLRARMTARVQDIWRQKSPPRPWTNSILDPTSSAMAKEPADLARIGLKFPCVV